MYSVSEAKDLGLFEWSHTSTTGRQISRYIAELLQDRDILWVTNKNS